MRMIGYLTATSSEGWAVVLEVCERASPTEASAKESSKVLLAENPNRRSATTTVSGKGAHRTYLCSSSDLVYTALGHRALGLIQAFRSSMHEKQVHGHPRRCSYFTADLTRYS
ncbi:hypothetical protein BJV78DRAFT_1176325 [Lactifluus subvellereus]|nr:hypothetical protein BJV78DRAFT_1176325 [Lactifluus subvellereus]